jgi:hypothetical protein
MAKTYDETVDVQRRNEGWIMALPGVTGVSAVLRDGTPVLEVSVAPDVELPERLRGEELDGVPLHVVRRRYEAQ